MPRDSSGTYQLPPGTLVNTGDSILTSQHNPPFQDVAAALTNSLDRGGLGGMLAPLNMGGHTITNVADGVNPTDVATVGQVMGPSGAGVPPGTVIDFAGATPPAGWLLCAGQEVSRTDFAALFTAIGTTFGIGNGSTTFNVPDCRGRVSVGKDNMGGTPSGRLSNYPNDVGAGFGGQSIAMTADQMPVHSHGGSAAGVGDHTHMSPGLGSPVGASSAPAAANGTLGSGFQTSPAGAHSHSLSIDAAGGGGAHENVQPSLVFNKLVKT